MNSPRVKSSVDRPSTTASAETRASGLTPPRSLGVGYVHPVQADVGAIGGDFFAIGTHNGLGTSGGSTNCANDYDAKWSIYTDGVVGGVYFCQDQQADVFTSGANPAFSLHYGLCNGYYRWTFSFNGTIWECRDGSSNSATRVMAGLEVLSPDGADRNIDARYTNMSMRLVGNTSWSDFGSGTPVVSNFYSYGYVSNRAFNVYLAPLN